MRAFRFHYLIDVALLWCITLSTLNHRNVSNGIILLASTTRIPSGNETDKLALLAIKALITEDPLEVTSSWNESFHFCQWNGVSCSRRHQRVTQLKLNSRRMAGYLSPSIGNLSFLQVLDLSNNSFQGDVVPEIGQLFRLKELYLADNSLGGQIPTTLANCSNMRILELSSNNFTGRVPYELGSLSKLVELRIVENNLEGSIPPQLGNISSLQVLSMFSNKLRGEVPTSLGQLKKLTFLNIAYNMLSGMIPQPIYNLSHLNTLHMGNNHLQGKLPLNIGVTLPKIEVFIIWRNQFHGTIPFSISNVSNLLQFDISINNFVGGVPSIFGNLNKLTRLGLLSTNLGYGKANDLNFITSLINCTRLRYLFLADSNFGGVLPNSLGNLSTRIEVLSVELNQISGSIPSGIGNLVSMNSLAMYRNQLTGTIPTTIGKLHELQEVGFGKNKLSGRIPSSIGNLTLLNQLWLEENNFQGSIPSSLGNCKNLILLHLYGNALSGPIPLDVITLSSLSRSLKLSRNRLSGPLPREVGKLINLVELDVSQNELSGNIPSDLGASRSLIGLYMDHNLFEGTIPESLLSLKGIEEIDLSHNNFSGKIPRDFADLVFLSNLNLSYNNLEGEVPVGGVFSNVSAISVSGNKKLCGGIPELQLAKCFSERKRNLSFLTKLIISIVCGLVGVCLISILIICWLRNGKNKRNHSTSFGEPFLSISYGELLQATNGFSSDNLIATGSFCSVFKGILAPDQISIAVKVLNLEKRGASKSFMAECEALRNIRHRNLVKIITACSSIDYQGNDFKALVYEFMPNGSLELGCIPFHKQTMSKTKVCLCSSGCIYLLMWHLLWIIFITRLNCQSYIAT